MVKFDGRKRSLRRFKYASSQINRNEVRVLHDKV